MRVMKPDEFFSPATELAPLLLGKWLCRRLEDGSVLRARIVETECYFGEEDTACHAHKGKTPRTEVLYMRGGVAYVYLCYGMHSLLNVVSGEEGHPEAVLLRGVEGHVGPGRLTRYLQIDCRDNRTELSPEGGIWIEDDGTPPPDFSALPRVGIDYAAPADRDRPWRFVLAVESVETAGKTRIKQAKAKPAPKQNENA